MSDFERAVSEAQPSPRWDSRSKLIIGAVIFVIALAVLIQLNVIFVPLILASILAYVLQPLVEFFEERVQLRRGHAVMIIYLILVALLVPLAIYIVPLAIEQFILGQRTLLEAVRGLNQFAQQTETIQFMGFELGVDQIVTEITSAISSVVTSVASGTVSLVFDTARTLLFGIFTIIISFYMTRDADKLVSAARGIVPPQYRYDVHMLLTELDTIWSAFFRGMLILSLTVGVILTIVSTILGLPNPLLMGIWGGLLEFMPSIGNIIWGTTAVIVAAIEGSTYINLPPLAFVLLTLLTYIAFSQLDINILVPNILGRHVQLHPGVVLVGVIIGLSIGGVLGVALAAPTIASLRVVGRYVYAKLFDLDPFPMVGPPAASPEERERIAEEREQQIQTSHSVRSISLPFLRTLSADEGGGPGDDDEE